MLSQVIAKNVGDVFFWDTLYIPYISKCPEIFQFLDNDIFSLTALIVIVDPKRSEKFDYRRISQQTLSLYLMTQCQLKLRHSVTSLAQTLGYIKATQRTLHDDKALDYLTLKLTERKLMTYLISIVRVQ